MRFREPPENDPRIWSDADPAIKRMREVLQQVADRDQPAQDGPGAEIAEAVAPASTSSLPTRRERVAELLRLVRSGDRAAIDLLRRLLQET